MSYGGIIMQTKIEQYRGHMYVLLAVIGFGIVPLLAKFSLDTGMNSETMLTYRFLIAGAIFIILCKKNRYTLYKDAKTTIKLLSIGVLYAIEATCYFEAYKYLSPSLGELLFQVNPIFITFGAFLVFREKVTKDTILALLLTATGCTLLFWEPISHVTFYGIGLILLAVIFYTTYVLVCKRILNDIEPMVVTTYTTVGCGIILLVYSTLTRKLMVVTDLNIIGIIIILSIFSTIISLLFFAKGLKLLGAGKAAIITTLEPVVTVFLSFIIYKERLNIHQVCGGLFIILSILAIEGKLRMRKSEKEIEEEKMA